jgi:hypothetical protein
MTVVRCVELVRASRGAVEEWAGSRPGGRYCGSRRDDQSDLFARMRDKRRGLTAVNGRGGMSVGARQLLCEILKRGCGRGSGSRTLREDVGCDWMLGWLVR